MAGNRGFLALSKRPIPCAATVSLNTNGDGRKAPGITPVPFEFCCLHPPVIAMLGRSEFCLRQGFDQRPKRLYGAPAPPARRPVWRWSGGQLPQTGQTTDSNCIAPNKKGRHNFCCVFLFVLLHKMKRCRSVIGSHCPGSPENNIPKEPDHSKTHRDSCRA